MKIDLAKDQKKIRGYILQRIKDYPTCENDGPGEFDAAIQLITTATISHWLLSCPDYPTKYI